MLDLEKYRKYVGLESSIAIVSKLVVLSSATKKNVKSKNTSSTRKRKKGKTKRGMVDFHIEMVKKIDTLIEEHDGETKSEEPEVIPQKHLEEVLDKIIERREPFRRKPEIPGFRREIQSMRALGTEEDPFDMVTPEKKTIPEYKFVTSLEEPKDIVFIESIKTDDEGFRSKMLNEQDETAQKKSMAFGFGKTKNKNEKTKQKPAGRDNKTTKKSSSKKPEVKIEEKKPAKKNLTKAEKELEHSRMLIEEKKKELELAEQTAKEKEGELRRKAIEQKKREIERQRQEKIEAKRRRVEAKKREKELKMKKKAEELIKKIEAKKAQKEARIKEKEARERAILLERKKRKLEAEKALETKKLERKKLEAKRALEEKKKLEKKLEEQKKLEAKKKLETEKKPPEVKEKKKKVKKEREKAKAPKPEKHPLLFGKKEPKEEPVLSQDEDLIKVLKIADELLEKLPDEAIDEFVQSEDFELYEKVISRYKVK